MVEKGGKMPDKEKLRPAAQVEAAIKYIPADVARALLRSKATDSVVEAVAMAAKRTSWRKVSDRATDDRRRITISARVPKDQGDYFKLLAKLSRRSLYRFVLDALEAEAARVENQIEAGEDPGGQLKLF